MYTVNKLKLLMELGRQLCLLQSLKKTLHILIYLPVLFRLQIKAICKARQLKYQYIAVFF